MSPQIADGVYLDLPMADYVRDRALSGSAFKKLPINPPDWQWEHGDNPLYREPQSEARDLGTAVHKAVLEGIDAYDAEYAAEPNRDAYPGAIETVDELRDWLRPHKERDPNGVKLSGTKDALFAQCQAIAEARGEHLAYWPTLRDELIGDRIVMRAHEDANIRLLHRLVHADPVYSKLLSDGLAEVSIFWTEDGVRYKARLDWLRATAIVDLKTFARVSPRGLLRGFLADRIDHGDDMQAVHAARAVAKIATLDAIAFGDDASERIAKLQRIAAGEKVFVWLGLRVMGGPTALAVRFDKGTLVWAAAEQKIGAAVAAFREYRARFGDALWIRSEGLIEPDVYDWPSYATDVPDAWKTERLP